MCGCSFNRVSGSWFMLLAVSVMVLEGAQPAWAGTLGGPSGGNKEITVGPPTVVDPTTPVPSGAQPGFAWNQVQYDIEYQRNGVTTTTTITVVCPAGSTAESKAAEFVKQVRTVIKPPDANDAVRVTGPKDVNVNNQYTVPSYGVEMKKVTTPGDSFVVTKVTKKLDGTQQYDTGVFLAGCWKDSDTPDADLYIPPWAIASGHDAAGAPSSIAFGVAGLYVGHLDLTPGMSGQQIAEQLWSDLKNNSPAVLSDSVYYDGNGKLTIDLPRGIVAPVDWFIGGGQNDSWLAGSDELTVATTIYVPEPASLGMLAIGALLVLRWRRGWET